jgi:hypothetical protein
VPLDNLLAAVSSQIFVVAAIFAVASLLVRERESGTLAWVASKPVSRTSIWLAKWVSASGILAVVAVIVPLALTVVAITGLYGTPDAGRRRGRRAGLRGDGDGGLLCGLRAGRSGRPWAPRWAGSRRPAGRSERQR